MINWPFAAVTAGRSGRGACIPIRLSIVVAVRPLYEYNLRRCACTLFITNRDGGEKREEGRETVREDLVLSVTVKRAYEHKQKSRAVFLARSAQRRYDNTRISLILYRGRKIPLLTIALHFLITPLVPLSHRATNVFIHNTSAHRATPPSRVTFASGRAVAHATARLHKYF